MKQPNFLKTLLYFFAVPSFLLLVWLIIGIYPGWSRVKAMELYAFQLEERVSTNKSKGPRYRIEGEVNEIYGALSGRGKIDTRDVWKYLKDHPEVGKLTVDDDGSFMTPQPVIRVFCDSLFSCEYRRGGKHPREYFFSDRRKLMLVMGAPFLLAVLYRLVKAIIRRF